MMACTYFDLHDYQDTKMLKTTPLFLKVSVKKISDENFKTELTLFLSAA